MSQVSLAIALSDISFDSPVRIILSATCMRRLDIIRQVPHSEVKFSAEENITPQRYIRQLSLYAGVFGFSGREGGLKAEFWLKSFE